MTADYSRNATRYVSKLASKLRREMEAHSYSEELTGVQGRVLCFILMQEPMSLNQKSIEEEYDIRPSSASELLAQLEKKGFIVRKENPENRREKRIAPTEKALAVKDEIRSGLDTLEDTLVGDIPEGDLEIFLGVIEKMLVNIDGQ